MVADIEWERDPGWFCADCQVHTGLIGEYYMVRKDLWQLYGADRDMLCIECLESRVGRELRPQDFPELPVNNPAIYPKSELIMSRMRGY